MLELQPYRFDYRASPEDAARSLTRVLALPEGESITGVVSSEAVKLYKPVPWWSRRSFEPVFVGRFLTTPEGCALVGRFRMAWDGVVFLMVFFSVIGYKTIETALSPEQRSGYISGWRARELAFDLQFIGLTVLLVAVLWIFGTNKRKRIINVVQASI
jgi:hypothetical protein